jgi:hypothetical protein
MRVFPILGAQDFSRCVIDALAKSTDAVDVRLAKGIRRTRNDPPRKREAALELVAPDWERRVSQIVQQCREQPFA